jgi:ribosomal protein S18 acetylase RimI-like enzyme
MSDQIVLAQSKNINDFLLLLKEMDELGDLFRLAVLHWCGYGQPENPPIFWQVYLVKLDEQVVGITGLYQPVNSPPNIVWLGWFGVRPSFRRSHLGTAIIEQTKKLAIDYNFQELWLFTDQKNYIAQKFYENQKFHKLGSAQELECQDTFKLTDLIFQCNL